VTSSSIKSLFYFHHIFNGSLPLLTIPKTEASGSLDNDTRSPRFSRRLSWPSLINRHNLGLPFFPLPVVFFLLLPLELRRRRRRTPRLHRLRPLHQPDSDQKSMATLRSSSASVSSSPSFPQICIGILLSSSAFIAARRKPPLVFTSNALFRSQKQRRTAAVIACAYFV
jgi:hypothetical protein